MDESNKSTILGGKKVIGLPSGINALKENLQKAANTTCRFPDWRVSKFKK
jgi:hypothetical protein